MKANVSPNQRLLTLTREMLALAQASEWEQLAELEQTRRPLFDEIFAGGIADNVELAQEILLLDEKTKKLGEAGMPALQDEILMMRKLGKANNAYQAIQNIRLRR